MPAWVVDLPLKAELTGQLISLKCWSGRHEDILKWDLRLLLRGAGYNLGLKNGGVSERLKGIRHELLPLMELAGMDLAEPHSRHSYASEAQQRRMRESGLEKPSQQKYWVSTSAALITMLVLANYRKGWAR